MHYKVTFDNDQLARFDGASWTDIVTAIGSIITPLVVLAFSIWIARKQNQSAELQKVRLAHYDVLVPDLNTLMCYLTFIGSWRDISPVELIALKRRLDQNFHSAVPLFSESVARAYDALMDKSFSTFGRWGEDAKIRSSAIRRREAWRRANGKWPKKWDRAFLYDEKAPIPAEELSEYRQAYDDLLVAIVNDLSLSSTRNFYTTARVSLNAGAPTARKIT